MKNIRDFKGINSFYRGPGAKMLQHTLEDFFSAKVRLYFNAIDVYKSDFNIDILNNPNRNVYIDGGHNRVLLISFVKREDLPHRYYLGLSIESPYVPFINPSIFNKTASKADLQELFKIKLDFC